MGPTGLIGFIESCGSHKSYKPHSSFKEQFLSKKLKVGVIFGGRSGEHEVSLRSAESVINALDRGKYEIVPIAITNQGKWLASSEATNLLPSAVIENADQRVAIFGDED